MPGDIDSSRLEESLNALRREGLGHGLPQAMEALCAGARALFQVKGAGLMVADDESVLRYVAATDGEARILEEAQADKGYGPCVEALVKGELVKTSDLLEDERWPGLLESYPDCEIRAVLGVPVKVAGGSVGSLNVYSDEAVEWDESHEQALVAYAELSESTILGALYAHEQDRVTEQLEGALESRVVIERAVGMLMEREGIDPVAAFERLRKKARSTRRRVRDLADDVIAGEPL